MILASVVLMLSALEIDGKMIGVEPDQVYGITAWLIMGGPWAVILIFATATIISLIRASRGNLVAPGLPSRNRVTVASIVSTLAVSIILYVIFSAISSHVAILAGRSPWSDEPIWPNSPEWVPLYTLLLFSLLISLAPLLFPGVADWVHSTRLFSNPRTVEKEWLGALGLGGNRSGQSSGQINRDSPGEDVTLEEALLGIPTREQNAANSPLEKLALEQSDGHARLILKYYAQGYSQANLGFRFSLFFAVMGFIAIVASGMSLWLHGNGSVIPTSVTGAAGGISGAVSFLFFRRADKGRELMMDLVDKLREDGEKELNLLRSLEQMEKFESGSLKDALRTAATLQFLNSSVTLEQLSSFLNPHSGEVNQE